MSDQSREAYPASLVGKYIGMVRDELHARWDSWPLDLEHREMHEVVGALLARQVTLVTQLARAPSIWNGHIAPVLLRTMADTNISLAWILDDPLERSRKFILYGLGQAKLEIEHKKAQLAAAGVVDVDNDPGVQQMEEWLNSQRHAFLTEVNVGSWSDKTTRQMAEEAACLDLYNYSYGPFSAATHSMWHHVDRYNLATCPNPLHRFHRVPIDAMAESDFMFVYLGAQLLQWAFEIFDRRTSVRCKAPSAFVELTEILSTLGAASSGAV